MINEILVDVRNIWKKRAFAIGLPFIAILSFCTLLINPTIGIDDTAFDIYFEEGVAPAAGRWCLFLINKIFPLSYNPYFMEIVGVVLFCLSVSLWCIVFMKIFGKELPDSVYLLFGCVMISSPITAEVVTYYLHNGIFIGYGMVALAVILSMKLFQKNYLMIARQKVIAFLASSVCLTIALGFYESFMIVFLMGMAMVFLSVRIVDSSNYEHRLGSWIIHTLLTCITAILFRTVIVQLMILIFRLEEQTKVLQSRGIHEFLGWFNGTRNFSDLSYVMKDYLVKYYINGFVYLPITILVIAIIALLMAALWQSIRKKDGLIMASALVIIAIPWVMPILEGSATFYRSAQYIPLLTAFSTLLAGKYVINRINVCKSSWGKGALKGIALFLTVFILYAQTSEMNKWLYIDEVKYDDTKRTLDNLALAILRCDNPAKPICIIGEYDVPESISQESYCPNWSKKYQIVELFIRNLDETIWDTYNTSSGYAFAETPRISFLNWGMTAFYGFDRQIIKFWEMQGYTFSEDGNLEHYAEAMEEMADGPVWPQDGSVVEKEDYIIVNLG